MGRWLDFGQAREQPDTSAPVNAAASGGIPALRPRKGNSVGASTSVRRKVLDTAPMSPAAAAIFIGLLNITEKPNTPTKLISIRKSVRPTVRGRAEQSSPAPAHTLGNHPTYEGRHHNNRYGIRKTLNTASHFELSDVETCRNEGKAGNHKEHGADIAFLGATLPPE